MNCQAIIKLRFAQLNVNIYLDDLISL